MWKSPPWLLQKGSSLLELVMQNDFRGVCWSVSHCVHLYCSNSHSWLQLQIFPLLGIIYAHIQALSCVQTPAGPAFRCAYGAVRVLGAAQEQRKSIKICPRSIASFLLGEDISLVPEKSPLVTYDFSRFHLRKIFRKEEIKALQFFCIQYFRPDF